MNGSTPAVSLGQAHFPQRHDRRQFLLKAGGGIGGLALAGLMQQEARAAWPGATADSDADGATNGQEFAAGTDPLDRSDSLSVSLSKLEEGQRLEWNTRPGAIYQLQQTGSLGVGNWLNVGEPVLALEDRSGITLESVENMNFYRIKKIR